MTATEAARTTWDEMVGLLRKCKDDPVRFHKVFLNRPPLWSRQIEVARSVVTHRVTCVYSGNQTGKDFLIGSLVPWFLITRPDSLVIICGPGQTTIGSVTMKEIRRALDSARLPFKGRISSGIKASPAVVEVSPGWMCLGHSSNSVERASGHHAGSLLVIAEEASGIEPEAWEALDSLGYERLLAVGNPLRADGRFVELIAQARRDKADRVPPHLAVNAIRIPSTESPHANLERSPVGLADKTWLAEMSRRYGERSLWYRSHILAEVPSVSADVLIDERHLDWAAAGARVVVPAGHPLRGPVRIGVDLGEGVGRDSSAIVVRDDLGILEVVVGGAIGLYEAAGIVARLALVHGVRHDRITYDRLGIGRDFPHHLARHGITAQPYAGSGEPRDKGQFPNLRSEAAWSLKRRLDPQYLADVREHRPQPHFNVPPGPYWPRLREELAALTYDLAGRQTRLIPKRDLCAKLGRSPDLADALISTFAFP